MNNPAPENNTRIYSLDYIKGVSVLGIILYHFGFLTYGYLGVDVFLVTSGFLIIPPVIKNIGHDNFNVLTWLKKRLIRFFPLILIISSVALILGYFLMLPDDFENLSESVFATNIFGNNILQAVTVRNYWNITNEYKPLLPTWYLGVLVQLLVMFGLSFYIFNLIIKKAKQRLRNPYIPFLALLTVLFGCSFFAYLFSGDSFETKFYSPFYRGWEFFLGGLVFYIADYIKIKAKLPFFILIIGLIGIFFLHFICRLLNVSGFFNKITLQIIAAFLCIFLLCCKTKFSPHNPIVISGKMSFSLFLWHQFILAFERYLFGDDFNTVRLLTVISVICVVSVVSYKYFEKIKLSRLSSKITALTVWVMILFSSYYFYSVAGVVRDIKELGVTTQNPTLKRNTEYIDRFLNYTSPLVSDKIKVLAIGNSFARDFLACLEEWDVKNKIEISYKSDNDWNDARLENCDFIFCTARKEDILPYISEKIKPDTQLYGIGTKSYGKSLGPVYTRRHNSDYYKSTIRLDKSVIRINNMLKESWGEDNYINFISLTSSNGVDMRVFTPEGMLISFDGMHLTQDGAKYYAKCINFEKIFRLTQDN